MKRVPEKLAELVERGQRPAKASPAGHARRPSPAHSLIHQLLHLLLLTAKKSVLFTPLKNLEPSADLQEKEENLSEESVSAQPELVFPSTEALSADPVDQTVADHDISVAIASKVNLTVPRENEDPVGDNNEETPATELPDLEDSPADPLLIALTAPIKDRSQEDSILAVPTVSNDPASDEIPDDPADPHDRKPEDHGQKHTVEPPDKKERSEDPFSEDHAVGGDPAADEGPTDPLHRRKRPAEPPDKKTISADPIADGDPLASADHAFVEKFAKSVGEGSRVLSEEHPDKDIALQLRDPRDENPVTPLDRDPSKIPTDSLDGIKRKGKKKDSARGNTFSQVRESFLHPGRLGQPGQDF
ncbi:hypothetical protein E4U09_003018 [Claviceps aff. purpurea]|uniref:Uncharacterized protein n=1 Tax=Claviceps aff. purpurea TaxID=1967640 RepID=A0A9P7U0Q8_9HYPO|nr:hypothetical protein E4U09_003018 [Claviceps aff. purpurea]